MQNLRDPLRVEHNMLLKHHLWVVSVLRDTDLLKKAHA